MAIRDHTDADFNAASRRIEFKIVLDLYDEATDTWGITLSKNDYLIDIHVDELLSSETNTPLGRPTANTLDVTLRNEDRLFTPTNTASKFYGKLHILTGATLFGRCIDSVDELNWIELGTFYLSDWKANALGDTATLLLSDATEEPKYLSSYWMPILKNTTFATFFTNIVSRVAMLDYEVASELTQIITYGFYSKDIYETVCDAAAAAMAFYGYNRENVLRVWPIKRARTLRATLTDADQIIEPTTVIQPLEESGYNVKYYSATAERNTQLVSMSDFNVVDTRTADFSNTPVIAIENACLQTEDDLLQFKALRYSPWSMSFEVEGEAVTSSLAVYGTYVKFTATELYETDADYITFDNKYVQSKAHAEEVYNLLTAFCTCPVPFLEVKIRGNLLLQLDDLIRVQSTKYDLDFTGVIYRILYDYDGGLGATLTLLNSEIIQEVA